MCESIEFLAERIAKKTYKAKPRLKIAGPRDKQGYFQIGFFVYLLMSSILGRILRRFLGFHE